MDTKQFLKEKGISNNDFMDSGVADLIETLLTEYQSLQLQQTGVIKLLPESDEIRMKARELDEKDFDKWWWETIYKGNVL
jgi:hypothetical protein